MELLERYLGAVRWNLPSGKADDILAEIEDVIGNRIEEREAALGRPLQREELSALLKDFGHPIAIAGRYHGQRVLIGPEVFPFYWFVLWAVLLLVGGVALVEAAGRVVFTETPTARALAQGADGLAGSLLTSGAIVTLIFAVIERTGWLATYLERWSPDQLPRLSPRAPRRKRFDPLIDVVVSTAFLLWWFGAIHIPLVPSDSRMSVAPSPVWASLYWPVAVLAMLGVARGLAALIVPGQRALRALLALADAALIVAIAWVLYRAGRLVTVVAGQDPQKMAEVQRALDLALHIALVVVPLIALLSLATRLWALYRQR